MQSLLASLVLVLAAASAAQEQPHAAASSQATGPDIVVEAHDADAIDRFVNRLTRTRHGEQLARWNDPICPRVLGGEGGHDAAMLQRIGETAKSVGVRTRGGKCTPNIIVIVAADGDAVVNFLVRRYPHLFQDSRSSAHDLDAMEAVLRMPRPVRWINASRTRNADGTALGSTPSIAASLLAPPTREDALLSLMIVDARQMKGVTWGQLADYVTMVALAKADPGVTYESGSILALFADRDAGRPLPDGLTQTDRVFLRTLYRIEVRDTASWARSTIKARMKGQ